MKSKIPLVELEGLISERENRFKDSIVSAAAIRMEPDRGNLVVAGSEHPVQDHVLTLLGPKLGIPAAYLKACPPELRAENFNHWMGEFGSKNLLVRFDEQKVRAVLSTRYQAVSDLDLVRGIREYLPPWSNPTVVTEVTASRRRTASGPCRGQIIASFASLRLCVSCRCFR